MTRKALARPDVPFWRASAAYQSSHGLFTVQFICMFVQLTVSSFIRCSGFVFFFYFDSPDTFLWDDRDQGQ